MKNKANKRSVVDGIQSLNDTKVHEFDIEELEARYETDPLFLSHIFGLCADDADGVELLCACKKLKNCPELTCVVDNCPEFVTDDKI